MVVGLRTAMDMVAVMMRQVVDRLQVGSTIISRMKVAQAALTVLMA